MMPDAFALASSSAAKTSSSPPKGPRGTDSSVSSMTRAMSPNRIVPRTNASTAASSAVAATTGAVPPSVPARRTSP